MAARSVDEVLAPTVSVSVVRSVGSLRFPISPAGYTRSISNKKVVAPSKVSNFLLKASVFSVTFLPASLLSFLSSDCAVL